MTDAVNLPNLPGYINNKKQAKNKSHIFDVVDGLPVFDQDRYAVHHPSTLKTIPTGTEFMGVRREMGEPSKKPVIHTINALPKWVAYDRKVLRFWCYTYEQVMFSNEENLRHRHFTLYYYLDTDMIHIDEMKLENSGIPQGIFLKKQKIPHAEEDRFINFSDIQINNTLCIFGRSFHVCFMDDSSRAFYEKMNIDQDEDQELPCDMYAMKRDAVAEPNVSDKTISEYAEARNGRVLTWQLEKERQFFAHDGKVLRFWAVWNDPSIYGKKHHYQVYYYLADDTIAISEIYPANAGIQQFPAFLSRSQLPKNLPDHGIALIGVDHTDEIEYITHADLRVGGFLTVYGRHMLLIRCDDYTKCFYEDIHNCTEEDLMSIIDEEEDYQIPVTKPPPHNGYGTEEDSLGSVKHLIPRKPRKDFLKLLKFDNAILRFKASLASNSPQDEGRTFVIEFFRSDDTLKIYECRCANSGFVGGKFLERRRLKNPETEEWFLPSEFFVGADVVLNGFNFHILEADEHTLKHMENDSSQFPFANKDEILRKLADKLWDRSHHRTDTFRLIDQNKDSLITEQEFGDMMSMYGWHLSKHEIMTLFRCYDKNGDGAVGFDEFVKALEEQKHGKRRPSQLQCE